MITLIIRNNDSNNTIFQFPVKFQNSFVIPKKGRCSELHITMRSKKKKKNLNYIILHSYIPNRENIYTTLSRIDPDILKVLMWQS